MVYLFYIALLPFSWIANIVNILNVCVFLLLLDQVLALPLPHRPLFPGFYMPIYVKVWLVIKTDGLNHFLPFSPSLQASC